MLQRFPALNGAELLSLDGEGQLQPWSNPAEWKLNGDIFIFRGTPIQAVLAGGYVNFYTSGRFDLGGELRVVVPVLHWGFDGQVSGFWDTERKVAQLAGTGTLTLPLAGKIKAQDLLSSAGALVTCVSQNGKYAVGGVFDYFHYKVSLFAPGTCEIGKYTLPAPEIGAPAPGSAGASRAGSSRHVLTLPGHLTGTTIAVHGRGAPPLVEVHGPGLSVSTPTTGEGLVTKQVFLYKAAESNTTYITLYSPHGGRWTITSLPGSSPVTLVRAALPAPRARLKTRVSGSVCLRTLTYTASVPAGESVALYAQSGATRTSLGTAKAHGRLAFPTEVQASGTGEIVAIESRGEVPRSVRTIARFPTVDLTRPTSVTGLRAGKHALSWTAACGAASYTIVVHSGKRVLHFAATSPEVKLPALHAPFTVTITAVAANGAKGVALTRTL